MFKKILFVAAILVGYSVAAQGNIKTMFYNLLEFPELLPVDRAPILRDIIDSYEPDIFMICELRGQDGADQVLNIALNDEGSNYSAAPYITNQSSSSDLQQMLYFRSSMFTLESSSVIETEIRDINRYVLRLNTLDGGTDPVLIDIYIVHLKSSQGGANQNLRLDMVTEFTNTLPTLDPNSFVIFAGDFNVYSSTEPAYQELLDETNAIVMVDPIDTPGAWNNNSDFQNVHTQSTRTSSGPFGSGAGGGMDDRFDFILVSENMLVDPKLRYIADTYKSYGNNGNCYNMNVNDTDCVGEFGQTLRNSVYNMSDHLPVVMELETNKEITLSGTDFDTIENPIELVNTIVQDELHLKLAPEAMSLGSFQIYNVLGQLMITIESNNTNKIIINVSHFANGIYYLRNTFSNSEPLKFLKSS